MNKGYFIALDFIIDIFFFIDIILSFRVTYFDARLGIEVKNLKKIAWNYIQSNFFIDLLSTLPIDTIALVIFFYYFSFR